MARAMVMGKAAAERRKGAASWAVWGEGGGGDEGGGGEIEGGGGDDGGGDRRRDGSGDGNRRQRRLAWNGDRRARDDGDGGGGVCSGDRGAAGRSRVPPPWCFVARPCATCNSSRLSMPSPLLSINAKASSTSWIAYGFGKVAVGFATAGVATGATTGAAAATGGSAVVGSTPSAFARRASVGASRPSATNNKLLRPPHRHLVHAVRRALEHYPKRASSRFSTNRRVRSHLVMPHRIRAFRRPIAPRRIAILHRRLDPRAHAARRRAPVQHVRVVALCSRPPLPTTRSACAGRCRRARTTRTTRGTGPRRPSGSLGTGPALATRCTSSDQCPCTAAYKPPRHRRPFRTPSGQTSHDRGQCSCMNAAFFQHWPSAVQPGNRRGGQCTCACTYCKTPGTPRS